MSARRCAVGTFEGGGEVRPAPSILVSGTSGPRLSGARSLWAAADDDSCVFIILFLSASPSARAPDTTKFRARNTPYSEGEGHNQVPRSEVPYIG